MKKQLVARYRAYLRHSYRLDISDEQASRYGRKADQVREQLRRLDAAGKAFAKGLR